MDPEDGWAGDEDRERRWFEAAQLELKADAEAYNAWLDTVSREFEERPDA
jgi:hypothetical protein